MEQLHRRENKKDLLALGKGGMEILVKAREGDTEEGSRIRKEIQGATEERSPALGFVLAMQAL